MTALLLRTFGSLLLLTVVPLGMTWADDAPLTEEAVTRLVVTLKIKPEAVAGMVRTRGVGFEADASTLERLKKAGIPDAVLDAVKEKASKPATRPTGDAAPAVTFDQVVEMLKFQVPESDMREAIKGTVFTLGKAQVDQLKKLGAADALIKELSAAKSIDPALELANLALLIDCSGSMSELTPNGSTKMDAAKKAATELIGKVPTGMYLSMIIYGHDQALRCDAVKVVRPLGPLDDAGRAQLIRLIKDLKPSGSTPIDLALVTAGKELAKAQGPSGVVLISDGKEMCGGNPARAAGNLARALKLGFGVQVVGFGVKPDEKVALGEIALAGHGNYYDAPTPEKLQDVVLLLARAVESGKKPEVIEEEEGASRPLVVKTNQGESLRFRSNEAWADRVVSFSPVGDIPRGASDPREALGMPNYDPVNDNRYVALGSGGEIVVEFQDNVLVDGAGPDLAVFEIGPLVEASRIWISEDGRDWIGLGQAEGGKSTIDIAKFVKPGQRFRFVKLVDAKNGGDGADIDAIGALNSLPYDQASESARVVAIPEVKKQASADEVEAPMSPKVRLLAEQLRDKSAEVSHQAAETLAKLGDKARGATNALIERLGDENCTIYASSTDSKSAALIALRKIAPGKVVTGLIAGANSKNELTRAWALSQVVVDPKGETPAIPNIEEATQRWVECLAAHLKNERIAVTLEAAKTLGVLGDQARSAAGALAERVADDVMDIYAISTESKDAALAALKKIAPSKVEEALFLGAKSKSEYVRTWATKRLVDEPEK